MITWRLKLLQKLQQGQLPQEWFELTKKVGNFMNAGLEWTGAYQQYGVPAAPS